MSSERPGHWTGSAGISLKRASSRLHSFSPYGPGRLTQAEARAFTSELRLSSSSPNPRPSPSSPTSAPSPTLKTAADLTATRSGTSSKGRGPRLRRSSNRGTATDQETSSSRPSASSASCLLGDWSSRARPRTSTPSSGTPSSSSPSPQTVAQRMYCLRTERTSESCPAHQTLASRSSCSKRRSLWGGPGRGWGA